MAVATTRRSSRTMIRSAALIATPVRVCRPRHPGPWAADLLLAEEQAVVGAPAQMVAAVHGQALAADPSGLGPGQKPDRSRDVLDRPQTADRHLGQVVVEKRAPGGDRRHQFVIDDSRLDRVDPDA